MDTFKAEKVTEKELTNLTSVFFIALTTVVWGEMIHYSFSLPKVLLEKRYMLLNFRLRYYGKN